MDVRSAAPVDPAGLEAILAPGAPGRMLPAEAYTSEAVLAWERAAPLRRQLGLRRALGRPGRRR